ncbi:MAG: hypothetical protein QXS43_12005 [Metallosphaera sp.]|uniref:hypothetical protein n=1 Tax=Metallosphaera sp. TaxID=2020860 RepID=UPI00316EB3D1
MIEIHSDYDLDETIHVLKLLLAAMREPVIDTETTEVTWGSYNDGTPTISIRKDKLFRYHVELLNVTEDDVSKVLSILNEEKANMMERLQKRGISFE